MALAAARHLLHSPQCAWPLNIGVSRTFNQQRTLGFSTYSALWNKVTTSNKLNDLRSAEGRWSSASDDFFRHHKITPHNAYTGRSIEVKDGDVATASRMLERILAQNNIPREWRRSFRHRQKGEERRKLESTRWRRRFKFEVSKKVKLVQQIRRRGS